MKALSIKQPWASLIAHGIKDVENRSRRTHFRGRIYIHASAQKDKRQFADRFTQAQALAWADLMESLAYGPSVQPLGAIIGEVDIIDCIEDSRSLWAEPGSFHWVLSNPVLYPHPVPCKGKLSFWDPPSDLAGLPPPPQKFND